MTEVHFCPSILEKKCFITYNNHTTLSTLFEVSFKIHLAQKSGASLNGHDSSAHNQYCDGDSGSYSKVFTDPSETWLNSAVDFLLVCVSAAIRRSSESFSFCIHREVEGDRLQPAKVRNLIHLAHHFSVKLLMSADFTTAWNLFSNSFLFANVHPNNYMFTETVGINVVGLCCYFCSAGCSAQRHWHADPDSIPQRAVRGQCQQ